MTDKPKLYRYKHSIQAIHCITCNGTGVRETMPVYMEFSQLLPCTKCYGTGIEKCRLEKGDYANN